MCKDPLKLSKKMKVVYMAHHNPHETQPNECAGCPSLDSCFLKCWLVDNEPRLKIVLDELWSIWEDVEEPEANRGRILSSLLK